jgi:hypothetical protein
VALNFEVEHSSPPISLESLRSESVVKSLIKEGRTPFLMRLEDREAALCFIPPAVDNPNSAQSLKITLHDAGEIASIRRKLLREI